VQLGGFRSTRLRLFLVLTAAAAFAVGADGPGPAVSKFLRAATPRVVLTHVEVIDGTGAAPMTDRNVTIEGGKIASISAGADVPAGDAATTVLDLRGYSVLPGIVGMHGHLFSLVRPNFDAGGSSDAPAHFQPMGFSAPRLYLANGVTTMRTAGSVVPYADLKLKRMIETGGAPGPHLDVTGPYLNGPGTAIPEIHDLTGPEDARQTVAYWADRGVTSFKAYKNITREELRAAIAEAHKRGLKVTGHLCSVTYPEAVEIGIDDFEHGFFVNTANDPDKKPDTCSSSQGDYTLEHMAAGSPEADRLISSLVRHHVAITSTLPSTASSLPNSDGRAPIRPAVLEAMSPDLRDGYFYGRNRPANPDAQAKTALLFRRDMDLERAFVAAGGLLIAGSDPVGVGGLVPGFADQREIELLVEAGFTPVQAIRIATFNGATYLGRQDRIGSIAAGKNADLVVVKGDPAARIADIENVEIVFQDGLGYDSKKLLESVKGRYGEY
jgi:imidazolonepropionase-like amidohydrolase